MLFGRRSILYADRNTWTWMRVYVRPRNGTMSQTAQVGGQ